MWGFKGTLYNELLVLLVNLYIVVYCHDLKAFDDTVLFKINWPGKSSSDLLVSYFTNLHIFIYISDIIYNIVLGFAYIAKFFILKNESFNSEPSELKYSFFNIFATNEMNGIFQFFKVRKSMVFRN